MTHTTTIVNDTGIDLVPKRKSLTEETEMDITPMIDIVFLLLSFFVVGSKMDPQFQLVLPKSVSGEQVSDKISVALVIKKGSAPGQFEIYKGRNTDPSALITSSDPIQIEQDVADYVEVELSKRPEFQAVLIKAEGEVTTGIVQTIKRGISMSEMAKARRIFLAVEQGE